MALFTAEERTFSVVVAARLPPVYLNEWLRAMFDPGLTMAWTFMPPWLKQVLTALGGIGAIALLITQLLGELPTQGMAAAAAQGRRQRQQQQQQQHRAVAATPAAALASATAAAAAVAVAATAAAAFNT